MQRNLIVEGVELPFFCSLINKSQATFLFFIFLCSVFCARAQVFRPVHGWPDQVNEQLEAFLNGTIITGQRKVAVFDCDGTLFGQVPYYLADEALYSFALKHYANKEDSLSKKKMFFVNRMLHENNSDIQYEKDRINFIAGMPVEAVSKIGFDCYKEKYRAKFYPQMMQLLADLKAYGFEIWVISASPEILYQGFVHEALAIPLSRIIGIRSVIHNDRVTNELVLPVPQNGGKADAIQTIIKARPLFAAGNSRGDMEMMNESTGLKMIVNPDNEKVEEGAGAGDMNGYSVEQYWKKQNALIVHCADTTDRRINYVSRSLGIKENKPTK